MFCPQGELIGEAILDEHYKRHRCKGSQVQWRVALAGYRSTVENAGTPIAPLGWAPPSIPTPPPFAGVMMSPHDVAADGKTFAVVSYSSEAPASPPIIRVVENWLEELRVREQGWWRGLSARSGSLTPAKVKMRE